MMESESPPRPGPAVVGANPNLDLLQSVFAALSIKQAETEILRSACEVLCLLLEARQAVAWRPEKDEPHFSIGAAYRFPAEGASKAERFGSHSPNSRISPNGGRLSVNQSPWLRQLMKEKRALALADVLGDASLFTVNDPLQEGQVMTALLIPILTQGNLVGFFELNGVPQRGFQEQQLDLAQSLASAVGEAIEAAKLHQRLKNYAEFLDQALAQRTLELKGERYRTQSILEALGEAVVVTDLEGKIQYVNQAAVELTGYSREELLGQRMRLWRSHRQTAELYTQMLDAISKGQTWRGEVINERKDGTLYAAALTVAPLFDPRDYERSIGYVSVQRDITPVKEAERLKDQFVSNVSHELRTPLSIIMLLIGNLDTLYDQLGDEKRRKLIRDIREHTQVLNNLISSVLEISRIDGGQVSGDHQWLNLALLAREEAEKQTPLARDKGQTLQIAGVEELAIKGNEGQLRQVIRNLVNNAIKYTAEGGRILCECRAIPPAVGSDRDWPGRAELPRGRWAAFRVADTGIGISQEDLPHLFERFHRIKPQGNIPGAGLGLSIAKELVTLHSGVIAVASTPARGSVFAVYLPIPEEA